MEKPLQVEKEILFYAFRYALEHKSSALISVIENIQKNINEISTYDIENYIKEIDECEDYGWEINKKAWMVFKSELEGELKIREKL